MKLPLIQKMSEPEDDTPSLLPEGVAYKRFTMRVDKEEKVVHIPLRESDNFLDRITEKKKITSLTFKKLMREFRGIVETGE